MDMIIGQENEKKNNREEKPWDKRRKSFALIYQYHQREEQEPTHRDRERERERKICFYLNDLIYYICWRYFLERDKIFPSLKSFLRLYLFILT